MRAKIVKKDGKTYRIEAEPRNCHEYLIRVYELSEAWGTVLLGKAISNSVDYAAEQVIKTRGWKV